jgi:hypothetical protein
VGLPNDDLTLVPDTRDRVTALYGDRLLPPLGQQLGSLAGQLVKESALALVLVDATSLLEIERLYGARAFRTTLESLTQRIRTRVSREIGDDYLVTSGALEEEHILVFIPRPRNGRCSSCTSCRGWPRARSYVRCR